MQLERLGRGVEPELVCKLAAEPIEAGESSRPVAGGGEGADEQEVGRLPKWVTGDRQFGETHGLLSVPERQGRCRTRLHRVRVGAR